MTAVFEDILTSVEAQVQGLALAGIDVRDINIRDDLEYGLNTPNIQITTPRQEISRRNDGTNKHDDIGYPVLLTLTDKDNQNQTLHFDPYLSWRRQIIRHFRHQSLSGVDEVYYCNAEPLDVLEDKKWKKAGLWVSGVLLIFTSRETRGN